MFRINNIFLINILSFKKIQVVARILNTINVIKSDIKTIVKHNQLYGDSFVDMQYIINMPIVYTIVITKNTIDAPSLIYISFTKYLFFQAFTFKKIILLLKKLILSKFYLT